MRIALLEKDDAEATLISGFLAAVGHSCHPCQTGEELLHLLQQESFDMIVMEGKKIASNEAAIFQWIRQHMPAELPILLVAGHADDEEIFTAMAGGANDYLIRPIRRNELLIRVKTLLRRAYPNRKNHEQIQFGSYSFETDTGRVSMAGHQIDMTQKEFDLALLFFRNLNRPLSRAYILDIVWSREKDVPSRTMDTHVSRVRSKLQLRPENGFRLAPVYSYGYRLEQLPNKC